VLAGYRIGSPIGRGGMGIVYDAEHVALGRSVAVKIVAPELSTDLTFRERFLREARLAATLEHPSIIPIYDAGEVDGVIYIAMRRVHGSDLAAFLSANGPLDARRAIDVLRPVASALDAAHRRRLVHRDVKPQNILIEPETAESDEHVFLTDFGLTKRTDDSGGLTRSGMFVGTFRYAAPEQFQGTDIDGRTDEYALACVAQQCLTGSPPFAGDSDPQVMYGHLAAPPPPITAMRPDLPQAVDAVMARALAKEMEDRYPTCTAFVADLDGALTGRAPRPDVVDRTVVAPPPPPPPAAPTTQPPVVDPTRVAEPPPPVPAWSPAGAAPAAPSPAAVSPNWAPPAGPVAGVPVRPKPPSRVRAWALVAVGAVLAVVTAGLASDTDSPALIALVFAAPPALVALALLVAKHRGTRVGWGIVALLVGAASAVLGAAATFTGNPEAALLILGGILILIGGIQAIRHAPSAVPPPPRWG
jgi:serine/threonine-protein kinase